MSGYKLIDFKNIPIMSGVKNQIDGIYKSIFETKKVTKINNLILDGVKYPSVVANFDRKSPLTALVPVGATALLITITADDIVEINITGNE